MRSIQVLIVGGGASGMMAAVTAARHGAKVLVIEKKNRLGKKLLATGNGKCNFTNEWQQKECYRSDDAEAAWQIIQRFDRKACVQWFDGIGILAKSRNGYYYPASGQATAVLHGLERELKRQKAEIHTQEEVTGISLNMRGKQRDGFLVTTNQEKYLAQQVIISTGGLAAPVHGSTGDGYGYAESFGHKIIKPLPALTSLVLDGNFMKAWSGVRIQGNVSLYNEKNRLLCEDSGEIQMVAYGISGIPVFQLSRFAAKELAAGRNVFLYLDSMPEYEKEWLIKELVRRQRYDEEQSMGDLLEGMLPDKLAGVLLKQAGIAVSAKAGEISEEKVVKLADRIKKMKLSVKAVSDFDKAQVTAGGISLREINQNTMESLCCPNLYLTGELLDVDGICGGYNLQWAWTTGYLAGVASGEKASGKERRKQ